MKSGPNDLGPITAFFPEAVETLRKNNELPEEQLAAQQRKRWTAHGALEMPVMGLLGLWAYDLKQRRPTTHAQ